MIVHRDMQASVTFVTYLKNHANPRSTNFSPTFYTILLNAPDPVPDYRIFTGKYYIVFPQSVYQYFWEYQSIYQIKTAIQQFAMLSNQSNPESMVDFLALHSPQHSPQPQHYSSDPSQQKNGKWNQIQHAKYIVFMEYHRAEFKSKQQRRAHKFYKQMSAFIKTRNALQCRSHHQKLQDRYCYANKIILAFKQHGNMALYQASLEELKNYEQGKSSKQSEDVQQSQPNVQVSAQTDINGVNTQFYFVNPLAKSSNQLWSSPSIFNGNNAGQFLQSPVVPSCQGLYYSFFPNPYYINYL